ncbi:hypothetical protein [Legionella sp. PC997]|uniref:hypothetical protein n=1 Tax=Legionella sp. PC997 TaxID=2755562 RepID=UPI0015FC5EBD|nr:hypothetical protein [Legionella sp. PC997]QMT61828.1 hypothetical protein HBNCFIEN_03235 [Legionella sp. PC997]
MSYAHQLKNINQPQEVFLAFLDILGFSEFVKNNDHQKVIEIYQCVIRPMIDLSITEAAEQLVVNSSWIKQVNTSDVNDNLTPKFDNVVLHCTAISDSILLSTPDNTFKSLIILLATVRNLMAKLIYLGFPLRGAITSGLVTLDNRFLSSSNVNHHLIIGKAIAEAVELEKRQVWSGCAIHSSVINIIGRNIIRFDPVLITLYDVPMRNNTYELMPVVNWLQGF